MACRLVGAELYIYISISLGANVGEIFVEINIFSTEK